MSFVLIPDPRFMMVQMMEEIGIGLDMPKRVIDNPYMPSPDGETDCWAHAWQWAKENDAEYWEGICWPNEYTIANHAWCVKDGAIIEVEHKYAPATNYRGTPISVEQSDLAVRIWDATGGPGPMGRDSVIETLLVASFMSRSMEQYQ